MDFCLLLVLCVVYVKVCASGRSLVQRSPTDCGVSECGYLSVVKIGRASCRERVWIFV
jgi:hypothetical protein